MQERNYILNQMIDQLLFLLLLHLQNLLYTLMRTLSLPNRLLLYPICYLWILYNSIELRNNLFYDLFRPHRRLLSNYPRPILELRMNIDFQYVIFEKYNLHLPLLHILQATQHLKAQYLYICLLIKYKIQYIFIDGLIEKRVIPKVQFFKLKQLPQILQLLAPGNLIISDIELFQRSKLLYPLERRQFITAQIKRFDFTAHIMIQFIENVYAVAGEGDRFVYYLCLRVEKGRYRNLLLSAHLTAQLLCYKLYQVILICLIAINAIIIQEDIRFGKKLIAWNYSRNISSYIIWSGFCTACRTPIRPISSHFLLLGCLVHASCHSSISHYNYHLGQTQTILDRVAFPSTIGLHKRHGCYIASFHIHDDYHPSTIHYIDLRSCICRYHYLASYLYTNRPHIFTHQSKDMIHSHLFCYPSILLNNHIYPILRVLQVHLSSHPSKTPCKLPFHHYRYSFHPHFAYHSAISLYIYLHQNSNKFHFHFADPYPILPHTDHHQSSYKFHDLYEHHSTIHHSIQSYRYTGTAPFHASYHLPTSHHRNCYQDMSFYLILTDSRSPAILHKQNRQKGQLLIFVMDLDQTMILEFFLRQNDSCLDRASHLQNTSLQSNRNSHIYTFPPHASVHFQIFPQRITPPIYKVSRYREKPHLSILLHTDKSY